LAILVIFKQDVYTPYNSAAIVHFSNHQNSSYSVYVVQVGNVGGDGLDIKATVDENGGSWLFDPVYWASNAQFYILRKWNVDVYTDASIYQEEQPTTWVADPRNAIRI